MHQDKQSMRKLPSIIEVMSVYLFVPYSFRYIPHVRIVWFVKIKCLYRFQKFELKCETTTLLGNISFYEKDKFYTVAENAHVGVSEAGTQNEFEASLEVPPIPPTEREYSKVYKLSYFFAVSIYSFKIKFSA